VDDPDQISQINSEGILKANLMPQAIAEWIASELIASGSPVALDRPEWVAAIQHLRLPHRVCTTAINRCA
jgi:hypothetical protein